jgi:hypothetical protein
MEMRTTCRFDFVDLARLDIAWKPWLTAIIPSVRPLWCQYLVLGLILLTIFPLEISLVLVTSYS